MSEDALWRKTRAELSPWGVLQRIENCVDLGTPDLAYALRVQGAVGSGWIELKHAWAWPKRHTTPFVLPELTADQVVFARNWEKAGGRSWMLLQVGRGYWLLNPAAITAIFERTLTASGVRMAAIAGEEGRFPLGNILRALTQ